MVILSIFGPWCWTIEIAICFFSPVAKIPPKKTLAKTKWRIRGAAHKRGYPIQRKIISIVPKNKMVSTATTSKRPVPFAIILSMVRRYFMAPREEMVRGKQLFP